MQQRLNTVVSIVVPEEYVLITNVEYELLQQNELLGRYWTMKDLEERVGKKQEWIKENILYPPKFKKNLDVSQGGFVYYPKTKGEKWSFLASRMSRFLEDNFYSIFR